MAIPVGLLSSEMAHALCIVERCISNSGLHFTALRSEVETSLFLAWILLRFCVFDEEVAFLSRSLCLAGGLSYVKAGVAPTISPQGREPLCAVWGGRRAGGTRGHQGSSQMGAHRKASITAWLCPLSL